MEKAKVYFTDFRTPYGGDTMPGKLKKLIRKAPRRLYKCLRGASYCQNDLLQNSNAAEQGQRLHLALAGVDNSDDRESCESPSHKPEDAGHG